jgi:hypothetical protein
MYLVDSYLGLDQSGLIWSNYLTKRRNDHIQRASNVCKKTLMKKNYNTSFMPILTCSKFID